VHGFCCISAASERNLSGKKAENPQDASRGNETSGHNTMKLQNTASLLTPHSRPRNGRRAPEKGVTFGAALLGILCAASVFGLLALLFHAG
jgi:hypothetical protein